MIELYDYELSADAYKVRLLLSMLDVPYASRLVELYPAREHEAEWFRAISPRAELPVIVDAGRTIADVGAILTHLARTHDSSGTWYPSPNGTTSNTGETAMWLSRAAELARTCGAARLHDVLLQHQIDIVAARSAAFALLRMIDEHLWFGEQVGDAWLCPGAKPTIADIACFPDIMLAEEGGIELDEFGAIRRWGDRIRALPGFVPMPGIFPS
jgi:glutathione S-transferase